MRPEDVARYLKDHPDFFETYADMIGDITIPHPHGGRAIPISERQIISLREKNRILEGKLRELVEYGEENDAIGERVHRAALAMIKPANLEASLQVLYYNLREDFAVPTSPSDCGASGIIRRCPNSEPAARRPGYSPTASTSRTAATNPCSKPPSGSATLPTC
jgi:hypothetical protein